MSFIARESARHLHELWRGACHVDGLPENLRPKSRAEGYAVQAYLESQSASPLFGWKLAATSKAGQEHIKVDGPLVGRILREQVIPHAGTYRKLDENIMQVAELEFAFRFSRDIKPRTSDWDWKEALDCIESLHPAIELPDSRYTRYEVVGTAQLIADNACAHYFVLGEPSPDSWRELDLADHQPWGLVNGVQYRQAAGRNVLGDPRFALIWFLNEASQYGMAIRAGEIVTTGTCLVPIPISHAMRIEGDFGTLGDVSVQIA